MQKRWTMKLFFVVALLLELSRSGNAQTPLQIPVGLEVCMGTCVLNNDHNIATWIFNGKQRGRGTWSNSKSVAILTIRRYDSEQILIHDENPPESSESGLTADYEGKMHGDRIDGTVTLRWARFQTPTHTITWPWYAMIPVTKCESDATAEEAYEIGNKAMLFQQAPPAFQCFLMSAKQGNGEAKTLVGLMYRDHIGIDQPNYTEAFRWLKEAAIQGNYDAQVAMWQCYKLGIGTKEDPPMVKKWFEIAMQNPVMLEKNERREEAIRTQALRYDTAARVFSSMGHDLILGFMQ